MRKGGFNRRSLRRDRPPRGKRRDRPARRTIVEIAAFMLIAGFFASWLAVVGIREIMKKPHASAQGVVLDAEASSLTTIDSFTLRTNGGQTLTFSIASDASRDPRDGFVAGHLRSHAAYGSQIRVLYEKDGDRLLAERVEDR